MPNDPLAEKQWHLAIDRAYDFWDALPLLPSVRVAVIDSGIDGDHPEFAGKIAAQPRSSAAPRSSTAKGTARSSPG